MIRELFELLTVIERHDLETATLDELIDVKRELAKMIDDVESHIELKKEQN